MSKYPADQSPKIIISSNAHTNNQSTNNQNQYSTPVFNRFHELQTIDLEPTNQQLNYQTHQNKKSIVNIIQPNDHSSKTSKINNRHRLRKQTTEKRTVTFSDEKTKSYNPMKHTITTDERQKAIFTKSDHSNNPIKQTITTDECQKETIAKSDHSNKPLKIFTMTTDKKCGPKATITATIFNKKHDMLLDTGSQVNAISQHNIPAEILHQLEPAEHQISSYTGNYVDVLGTFETDVQIGNIKLENCFFYVTRAQCRTVIGTPALTANKIKIDLSENQIEQGDKQQSLSTTTTINNTNLNFIGLSEVKIPPIHMEATQACTIPKMSTKFLTITCRHELEQQSYYATMDTFDHNMEFGILVGKSVSVLGPENNTCIIRLCNINDHDVHIEASKRIINLHSVSVREHKMSKSTTISALVTNGEHDATIKSDKLNQVLQDVTIGSKNNDHVESVRRIISENLDAFATEDEKLGHTDKAVYDIDTGNTPPVAQTRYRTPHFLRSEMKNIIDKNVETGLMEPCSSPYAAPVLLVKNQMEHGDWFVITGN